MPFFSDRNKFQTMFKIMGCGTSARQPAGDLGMIYCKQMNVVPPVLHKRHSKTSERHSRRNSRPVGEPPSRNDELLAAYDKNYTCPELKGSRKVFLSQTQSGTMTYLGERRPCAPPVTPTPELLRRVQYIPSLQDIQAQRSLRGRLEDIEKTKKTQKAKQKDAHMKREAEKKKEELQKLRVFQRSQIYALNAAMTDLEHQRFFIFQQQLNKS